LSMMTIARFFCPRAATVAKDPSCMRIEPSPSSAMTLRRGCASATPMPIGMGVALAQPRRKVIALEGDGSILMQLGSLASVAARGQRNLAIVIMDNGAYQITGGQKTLTDEGADIVAIARGCGLKQSVWAADESAFEELIALSLKEDGPWLIGCRIDSEKPKDTTERDPPIIKDRFMRGLGVK